MRVKFIRDEQYENEGRNQGPKFATGEVYDFTEDFGQRYVRRGAVEVLDADKVVKENTFKPLTKAKTDPAPELVAPVAPPPANPLVEGPHLSPKPSPEAGPEMAAGVDKSAPQGGK